MRRAGFGARPSEWQNLQSQGMEKVTRDLFTRLPSRIQGNV